MRKLLLIVPLILLMTANIALPEDTDPFPLDKDWGWVYDDGNTEKIVAFSKITIVKGSDRDMEMYSVNLFTFDTYNNEKRTFYRIGQQIFEWADNNSRLWYDFNADAGATWELKWEETTQSPGNARNRFFSDINQNAVMTLVEKNVTVKTLYGEFTNCFHFKLTRPEVKDAGYVEEWFAPGVGCVMRVWDTIAGPHQQKLVDIVRPEPLKREYRMDIKLDKELYQVGEDINIAVTILNWSDTDITLKFPTSSQVDFTIEGYYKYGDNHEFTQAATEVVIPARDVYKWDFTHTAKDFELPSGRHIITARLVGAELEARQHFLVAPKEEDLPEGLTLTASTGKQEYGTGESVDFTLTVANSTNADIVIRVPEKYSIWYAINDLFRNPDVFYNPPTLIETTIPANGSVVFDNSHEAWSLVLRPGDYTLKAGLTGYKQSAETSFTVTKDIAYGVTYGVVVTPGEEDDSFIPVTGAQITLSPTIPRLLQNELSNVPGSGKALWSALSNDSGEFTLSDVPLGMFYVLSVGKDGFELYQETVRILSPETNIRVVLKPKKLLPEEPKNYRKYEREGLIFSFGAGETVYKPDSQFKMFMKVANLTDKTVSFTFDSEEYLDLTIKSMEEEILWSSSETAQKTTATAEYLVEIPPREAHVFESAGTFEGKVPNEGAKYIITGALRFTSSSIENLKPEDVSGSVRVIIIPPEAQKNEPMRVEAKSNRNEMVVDLKQNLRTSINIRTKNDNVVGEIQVSEVLRNYHAELPKRRFIKMIEVDADETIREDLESAVIRIYYDTADLGENVNPEDLVISHWHENTSSDIPDEPTWEDLESRVDTVNQFVEATTESFSSFALFVPDESTGVEENNMLPSEFTLRQNSPNPFNPSTTIEFSIPKSGYVQVTVYNIMGQEVAHLVENRLPAGVHRIVFDGSSYSSGVYFYRLTAPGFIATRKMLLIK